jgi:hypothetical protein
MLDLYNNKYDRQTLKDNIYAVKLRDIVITQILDVTFIARYILNTKYQLTKEDEALNINFVLQHQPHINKKHLIDTIFLYNSDDDSIDDFETVSNRDN